MHRFERGTLLAASPAEVFAFHENPHNISQISPFFLRIVEVRAGYEAHAGDTFVLHLRILGIALTWRGAWAAVAAPELLIDTAAPFPLQSWRHEHRFQAHAGGTSMTDIVTYRVRFGWLGKLIGGTLLRAQLALMFAGRHRATRRYFSGR